MNIGLNIICPCSFVKNVKCCVIAKHLTAWFNKQMSVYQHLHTKLILTGTGMPPWHTDISSPDPEKMAWPDLKTVPSISESKLPPNFVLNGSNYRWKDIRCLRFCDILMVKQWPWYLSTHSLFFSPCPIQATVLEIPPPQPSHIPELPRPQSFGPWQTHCIVALQQRKRVRPSLCHQSEKAHCLLPHTWQTPDTEAKAEQFNVDREVWASSRRGL